MGLLGKMQLFAKDTLKTEKVVLGTTIIEPEEKEIVNDEEVVTKEEVVEEDYVFVRQMTGHEKNVWEMSQLKQSGAGKNAQYNVSLEEYKAKLAVCCVCDENGVLLFDPEDYKKLSMNISAAKLEKIVDVAQKLNTITEEDREVITKNS
jgi:hypothetical protein